MRIITALAQADEKGSQEMTNINVFRGHLRLMSPIEMCLCLEHEELIRGLSTLEPDEQIRFINEFDNELANVMERYQEIKTSSILPELKKAYVF